LPRAVARAPLAVAGSVGIKGQVDGEDAALARQVAGPDHAAVALDAFTGNGQTEPQPRPVGAALLEGNEQTPGLALGKPAALVLDVDQHPPGGGGGIRPQRHVSIRPSELEGVLQQVGERRRDELPIHVDGAGRRHGRDRELEAAHLRLDRRRQRDLFHEIGERDALPALEPRFEPHRGERTVDEVA
jgi:hypothetical protein